MSRNVYLYILVMAIVTYLIRMLPLALAKNEIRSPFIKSFLYYVPYACLAAMTFPAILKATDSIISGAAGFLVALIAAYKEKKPDHSSPAGMCGGVYRGEGSGIYLKRGYAEI